MCSLFPVYFVSSFIVWKCETNIKQRQEMDKALNIKLSDESGSFVLMKSKKAKLSAPTVTALENET